jgi:hypothetical protein
MKYYKQLLRLRNSALKVIHSKVPLNDIYVFHTSPYYTVSDITYTLTHIGWGNEGLSFCFIQSNNRNVRMTENETNVPTFFICQIADLMLYEK